jgi:hypothetical protein
LPAPQGVVFEERPSAAQSVTPVRSFVHPFSFGVHVCVAHVGPLAPRMHVSPVEQPVKAEKPSPRALQVPVPLSRTFGKYGNWG